MVNPQQKLDAIDQVLGQLSAIQLEIMKAREQQCKICVASLTVNALSIYAALGRRRIKLKPIEHYMLSLNVADIGMVLFTFPFAISSFFAFRWLFSETGCLVVGFLSFLWGIQNLMTVMILAVTRYVAVCHPHQDKYLNLRTTMVVLTLSMVYSFVWSAMPLGVWGSYDVEPYGTGCTIAWKELKNLSYVLAAFLFVFLIPFVVIIGCYVSIYLAAARSSTLTTAPSITKYLPQNRVKNNKATAQQRHPTIKLGVLLSASYFVCWFPYALVSFWAAVADASVLPPIATALPAMLAKTSVLFNPVLYLLTNKRFRRRLMLLGSSRRSSSQRETSHSSFRSPPCSHNQDRVVEHSSDSRFSGEGRSCNAATASDRGPKADAKPSSPSPPTSPTPSPPLSSPPLSSPPLQLLSPPLQSPPPVQSPSPPPSPPPPQSPSTPPTEP